MAQPVEGVNVSTTECTLSEAHHQFSADANDQKKLANKRVGVLTTTNCTNTNYTNQNIVLG